MLCKVHFTARWRTVQAKHNRITAAIYSCLSQEVLVMCLYPAGKSVQRMLFITPSSACCECWEGVLPSEVCSAQVSPLGSAFPSCWALPLTATASTSTLQAGLGAKLSSGRTFPLLPTRLLSLSLPFLQGNSQIKQSVLYTHRRLGASPNLCKSLNITYVYSLELVDLT